MVEFFVVNFICVRLFAVGNYYAIDCLHLTRKLNTEPSIGASHQILVHLTKQLQRRIFIEIDQPETRIAYGSHV
jgi:hypothetical protein